MTPQLQQAIRLLQLSRLELIDEIRKELDANPVLADDEIDPRPAAATTRRTRPTASTPPSSEERARPTWSAPKRDATDLERARDREAAPRRSTGSSSSRTARSSSRCPRSRGGFEELPPIEQNLTKHAIARRSPALAAPDERLHRQRAAASPSSSSATSTSKGYLDLKGIERDGRRRARPTSPSRTSPREAGLDPEDAAEVLRDDAGAAIRSASAARDLPRVPARPGRGVRLRRPRDRDHRQAPAQPREAQLPGHRARSEGRRSKRSTRRSRRSRSSRAARRATSPRPTTRRSPSRPTSTSSRTATSSSSPTTTAACSASTSTRRSRKQLLKDPKAKEFIGEKLRNAQWLIRAIEQRRKTIIRVTECIVEKQREFFEKGVAYLKPMILRDVAETVGHARVDDLAA